MSYRSVLVALLALVPPAAAQEGDRAQDLEVMQGLWRALYVKSQDLSDPTARRDIRVLIKGETITFQPLSPESVLCRFSIDPAKVPREMNITGLEGANRGKTTLHVYEIEQETLFLKFSLASYDDERGTRERPKGVDPTTEPGQVTLVLVPAEQIHYEMLEPRRRTPGAPGQREALYTLARYFDALSRQRPDLAADLAAVPFYRDGGSLAGRDEVVAFHRRARDAFGDLANHLPAIRDVRTYAGSREALAPEVRRELDGLLADGDLVVEVREPRGSARAARSLVLIRLRDRDGTVRIAGVIRLAERDRAR